jgi:hypothetical protein
MPLPGPGRPNGQRARIRDTLFTDAGPILYPASERGGKPVDGGDRGALSR